MKLSVFSSLASLFLLAPTITCATVTTVQITGTGSVCDFSQNCGDGLVLTGSIQLTTLGGPDSVDAGTGAYGSKWMQMSLQLQWTGAVNGRYTSDIPGATTTNNGVTVWNDFPFLTSGPPLFTQLPPADSLYLSTMQQRETGGVVHAINAASMDRTTTDSSWLSSLAFDTTMGLAPGADATNNLVFTRMVLSLGDDGQSQFSPDSVQGDFKLTRWTVSAVPEPAHWALFSLGGVVMLCWLQRRRRPQD